MAKRTGGLRDRDTRAAVYKRRAGVLLAAALLWAGISPTAQTLWQTPGRVHLRKGSELYLELPALVQADANGCIEKGGASEGQLIARQEGTGEIVLRLMGIMPVKTMSVSIEEEKMLIPGGSLIGVAMETQGVLLVGTSDVGPAPSPAYAAGLRSGDSILEADGIGIGSAEELEACVETAGGREMRLTIERGGERFERTVQPAQDPRDGHWRLGAWVRDSTAGVGTLSFIDPQTGRYGALGHSISDIDTNTRMLLSEGEIYDSAVADVRRGEAGAPGELVGSFFDQTQAIGSIERNTDYGIYGVYFAAPGAEAIPIMSRDEVRTGPAVVISQIDNGPPQRYSCEIVRVSQQSGSAQRGLVLRITDARLLTKTGGIVQGMSGSPIIQDGKLAGAVTHVLVNDPTMGYGIFIESMLEAAG
ncbi:MAG: SpoIVB peptidase [Clostridia bacterium]|nr:SpoIVB peptidase [Clostridia bacterium]